jgi:GH25 family lysozyme M1 (1,4-beta-N-acetylmuramidase)
MGYVEYSMFVGIDYASVDSDPPPDFSAARRWGARFAVIRTAYTFGSLARTDPTWARDHVAARTAGLQVAPYLILGWSVDPAAQVEQLVAAYSSPGDGDLPVALDIEGVTGVEPRQAIAKVDVTVAALQARYGTVMIYTSCVKWAEQLGNLPSEIVGSCPLWLKVGYPWNPRNPPHLESVPRVTEVPPPWRATGSPGAFIEQFQGDAVDVPGFARTVDLSVFLPFVASASDPRTTWVRSKLFAAGFPDDSTPTALNSAIRSFQAAHGLSIDGEIGPATWAALCRS